MNEIEKIKLRYSRRDKYEIYSRYDPLSPCVFMTQHERERALISLIRKCDLNPVYNKQVLEIGCGSGSNLLQLIQMGFTPKNIFANELLEDRIAVARNRLPADVSIFPGDACKLDIQNNSFDIIYQSTVFSSILDDEFQSVLANE